MIERVTHHKHPTAVYEVVTHEGCVQAREPLRDMEEVTIYRNADGRYFVRRVSEFKDGRFSPAGE